jgi:diguanylate cyclase (GGDEF)-like protein
MQKAEDDLKDKDEVIDQLSIESHTDALTGAGNKAAFIKKMEELNLRMKENDAEFAFVMVDINKLKHINDDYGHRSGDIYINGCCRMMCEVFRNSPVFRIGGDEFVAVLEGRDYLDRIALVDQLRKDYENSYEQDDVSPWLRFSAAVGAADSSADDNTAEFVFKRADEEMYKDKARFKSRYGDIER